MVADKADDFHQGHYGLGE